ncbi:hypothetical protein [Thiothrix lacustris]|uniref:hypothetical protein n=1 Tax=Thiothrix lacustris TaxID=525917 RepID=UPI0027E58DA0|nr:hypothetical protein [Thiothrix lacustris]WMP16957.1 hypothetical protein RCS87_16485 [Thiothrix lacustris]
MSNLNKLLRDIHDHTQSYTTLDGEIVVPECLDWLEDGKYWQNDSEEDFDDDGRENAVCLLCSRYYIGEIDGDSASVWLNDDMQEVEV